MNIQPGKFYKLHLRLVALGCAVRREVRLCIALFFPSVPQLGFPKRILGVE